MKKVKKNKTIKRDISQELEKKVDRKIEARKKPSNIWVGLRMFGMVGWSVAIPALIGVGLGIWIDRNFESPYSWTLMMLFVGVIAGCFNAWYWIDKESKDE
ncbi:MAG: AtpZ/AtpI family protein [Prochloraceae cyanobacterium]|nr:AtpZ/AtpI family protein [Prochloraceae cyanobacterium]